MFSLWGLKKVFLKQLQQCLILGTLNKQTKQNPGKKKFYFVTVFY